MKNRISAMELLREGWRVIYNKSEFLVVWAKGDYRIVWDIMTGRIVAVYPVMVINISLN